MANDQICPWNSLPPGTLKFCEAHLCQWIVAPAETWSNVLYVLLGVGLLLRARKDPENRVSRILGGVAIAVGLFSALYHASHRWITETFDLGSMSLLAAFLLCHALIRLGKLTPARFWGTYWILVAASWAALFVIDGPPRLWVFSSMIFLYVYLEGFLAIRARRLQISRDYRMLFLTVAVFLISYAAWLTDFHRLVCDPENHFLSGHAVWHLLNAFCFLTLAEYLRQFGSPWLARKPFRRYA